MKDTDWAAMSCSGKAMGFGKSLANSGFLSYYIRQIA